eukprot:tig00000139_g8304.t1
MRCNACAARALVARESRELEARRAAALEFEGLEEGGAGGDREGAASNDALAADLRALATSAAARSAPRGPAAPGGGGRSGRDGGVGGAGGAAACGPAVLVEGRGGVGGLALVLGAAGDAGAERDRAARLLVALTLFGPDALRERAGDAEWWRAREWALEGCLASLACEGQPAYQY